LKEILFLIRDIAFGGGGERVAVNLANYFADHGYVVSIVTIAVPQTENIFILNEGIKVVHLNVNFKKGFNLFQKIRSISRVNQYFKKNNKPGIILGIGTYPNLLLSLTSGNLKFKKIGCQHCSYDSLNLKWRWLGQTFFQRLNALVSLTEADVPNWRKMNSCIHVIPNAYSFFPDEPASLDHKVLLSIGRIDFSKGFDLLLEVFEKFAETNKDWQLRIVGDGPMKKKIARTIFKKNIGQRIEVKAPTKNILEEYRDASVYVMTSRSEGLPMVLLEAKACGLPLVSFNIKTGPPEIIRHEKDGFLIERFDIRQMANKLTELCQDISKRKMFGAEARKDIRRFSPELVGKKWEDLFREICPEWN
jgi:glycosyltransferase involved in cell wall biosynthesis